MPETTWQALAQIPSCKPCGIINRFFLKCKINSVHQLTYKTLLKGYFKGGSSTEKPCTSLWPSARASFVTTAFVQFPCCVGKHAVSTRSQILYACAIPAITRTISATTKHHSSI